MSDERIERLEALVKQQLCKCVVGPYWVARNHCPLHLDLTSVEEIVRDQRGYQKCKSVAMSCPACFPKRCSC